MSQAENASSILVARSNPPLAAQMIPAPTGLSISSLHQFGDSGRRAAETGAQQADVTCGASH